MNLVSASLRVSAVLLLAIGACAPAAAERIKDLAQVGGVRGNALVGYGLVVVLDNSGDTNGQSTCVCNHKEN